MKRTASYIGCFALVCCFVFAVSRAKSGRAVTVPVKGLAVESSQATPVPKTIPLAAFVATGMPVVLSNVVALTARAENEKADRPAQLRFIVAGAGRSDLTSLNLLLYDFDEKGLLRRVDGWIRNIDLAAERGAATITIDLERRLQPNHKQVLAVERVNSAKGTWDALPVDLGRAAANALAGTQANAAIQRADVSLPDDYGAAVCSNGFSRAQLLTQAGDGASVTSYTCNQHERSFTFTFAGKALR